METERSYTKSVHEGGGNMRPRIYVAGPYSASDARGNALNVDKAIKATCELIKKGWAPFIPHLYHFIWTHPDGDFDYQVWTDLDFRWLDCCEAFFIIGPSKGANAELEVAKKKGLKIYYHLDEVPKQI